MELGLIGSAWHGTGLSVVEGIRKTKEIGFDAHDVFDRARIPAELGVRDATAWQAVSST
jgi:hypothetical protein